MTAQAARRVITSDRDRCHAPGWWTGVCCDCTTRTDGDAYEFADVVFTGTLVEIITPEGDIVVSDDPERFVFDVDLVFKGEAQSRQSVVTAREGASCGLEISGQGPFVVFARLDDARLINGAVEGDVYSSLCSGTRPVADRAVPASFGTPSLPVTVTASTGAASSAPATVTTATGEASSAPATVTTATDRESSAPASSTNGNSGDGFWIVAIVGLLVLAVGGGATLRRRVARHVETAS